MKALKTLERNWAKVAELVLIITYTVFMVFDLCVIIVDSQTGQKYKSDFVEDAYTFLEVVQVLLNLTILICYVILFVYFLILIRDGKQRFGSLYKQVIGFFSIIIIILTTDFVLNFLFFTKFDVDGDETDAFEK